MVENESNNKSGNHQEQMPKSNPSMQGSYRSYEGPRKKGFNPVSKKLAFIIAMSFFLMIPTGFVMGIVSEREQFRNSALAEVSSKWGASQSIGGPLLYVPIYQTKDIDKNTKKKVFAEKYATFLPNDLNITSKVDPEIRYRGIYKFVLYSGKINVSGNFAFKDLTELNLNGMELRWDESVVQVGISDMIGLKDSVSLKWNNELREFHPGIKLKNVFSSGLTANVKMKSTPLPSEIISFNYDLNLKGSTELIFLPLGKETKLKMEANWPNPSFTGAFLPESRQITSKNFLGEWKVLDLNRNYPQMWVGELDQGAIYSSAFGVNFLIPVDAYKETTRAVKYMILFIGLTFAIFFFVEIMNKKRIHPIQYIFVGISLVIFYLLLISLSEQLTFAPAYFISALSTVLMITLYSFSVFGGKKFSIFTGSALLALYGFLYVLLLNQDYSLLLGSLGLFSVLGAIMYYSRNLDWYALGTSNSSKEGEQEQS